MWILQDGTITRTKQIKIDNITYPSKMFTNEELRKSLGIRRYREVQPDARYYTYSSDNKTLTETDDEVIATYEAIPRLLDDRLEVNEDGTPMLDQDGNQVVTKGLKSIRIDDAVSDDEIAYINSITSIEGIIEYDNVKKQEFRDAQAIIDKAKQIKVDALDSLIVSANTVPFDADNQSINYMSSVIGLASFKMLQGMYDISDAKAIEELTEFDSLIISLYEATFKSRVEWKNANNTISNVQLETVAEALEKSMQEVSSIIVGAN